MAPYKALLFREHGVLIGAGILLLFLNLTALCYGVAFLANDLKAGHEVTLKILPVEFPKRDAEMQRFARVLKEALPLRHAHLVTVLSAGKTGPYCWIAREYIAGKTRRMTGEESWNARRSWSPASVMVLMPRTAVPS